MTMWLKVDGLTERWDPRRRTHIIAWGKAAQVQVMAKSLVESMGGDENWNARLWNGPGTVEHEHSSVLAVHAVTENQRGRSAEDRAALSHELHRCAVAVGCANQNGNDFTQYGTPGVSVAMRHLRVGQWCYIGEDGPTTVDRLIDLGKLGVCCPEEISKLRRDETHPSRRRFLGEDEWRRELAGSAVLRVPGIARGCAVCVTLAPAARAPSDWAERGKLAAHGGGVGCVR